MEPISHHSEPLPDLPQALEADLRGLAANRPIPGYIDSAVLAHARRTAARRMFQRRVLMAAPLAAAAGLALAVWLVWPTHPGRSGVPGTVNSVNESLAQRASPHTGSSPADLNGDGTVDMRDALALAQRVERGDTIAADDQNKDGVIDRRDVDAIAMSAVSLKGGGA